MTLFVPALFLLAAMALILRVSLLVSVVLFLAGLYGLSRLWTRHAARQLRVRRELADHAFTGDEVRVNLTVRNLGRLPIPWLEVWESVPLDLQGAAPPTQVFGLGGRRDRRFTYTLRCRRRGYFSLGPLTAHTGDMLGIEERTITVREAKHLTVYPRIVALQRLGLPTRSALIARPTTTPLFEDTTRIVGVRDYQPGDSRRRIHWSATARTGQLVVKQFQPAMARETLICLDLDPARYPLHSYQAVEQAIVVAASLLNHIAVREGLPAGLACEARDQLEGATRRVTLAPRAGQAQLMTGLELLARVEPDTGERLPELLRQESVNLPWGATMLVITGRLCPELGEAVLYLKRSGYAPAVILVRPADREPEPDRQSALPGVPVYRVWTDRDLEACG